MSVRNQLSDYELGEFFRSLPDLLALSLDANLSSDSAEQSFPDVSIVSGELWLLCRREFACPILPKDNCFLISTLSLSLARTVSVNKGSIVWTCRILLCTRRKNNSQPLEWVSGLICKIRCWSPKTRHFGRPCNSTSCNSWISLGYRSKISSRLWKNFAEAEARTWVC